MPRRKVNLDDMMSDQVARETRETGTIATAGGKELVGNVEHFYDRLGVAAIKLSATLKVGDIIEIGNDEEAVRQRISSMQINRKDVNEASAGDSVGIMLKWKVGAGSDVYRIS